ncbi:kinase [Nocardia cyriacigeorgica]|uniref:kinase n=1 Tax=Nocardia cyriacigeorgica TaxID=135487 RepID=UPI002454DF41|nr:kinase [Nocardia cyriacigeorgica]
MKQGLILYGAPAVGKDTITAALAQVDPRFRLFERLKAGPGRTVGYRITSDDTIERLANEGAILWVNERYGARYAIDRMGLLDLLYQGHIPVVHAGQPGVITAVTNGIPSVRWVVVELTCSRSVAHDRIVARGTGDTDARLSAFDATPRLTGPTLSIDTGQHSPANAASLIHAQVISGT